MPYRITATLKRPQPPGQPQTLTVELPDLETVQAELNRIERLRKGRVGLPEIVWETTTGQKWCLSVYDLKPELLVEPVHAPMAAAS
jgi:hypothetical protein